MLLFYLLKTITDADFELIMLLSHTIVSMFPQLFFLEIFVTSKLFLKVKLVFFSPIIFSLPPLLSIIRSMHPSPLHFKIVSVNHNQLPPRKRFDKLKLSFYVHLVLSSASVLFRDNLMLLAV